MIILKDTKTKYFGFIENSNYGNMMNFVLNSLENQLEMKPGVKVQCIAFREVL